MNEDISKKTKKSLYWNVGLKIPYEIFRFFASILTARILDPADFGIVSIATMVIFYANSFTNFGFNQVLVQKQNISPSHISTVFTFNILASLTMAFLSYFSAEHIANYFNSTESIDVIKVMSIVFILMALHDLPYVLLRRELEFKLITIVDMVRELLMTVLTLVFAINGYKYWSIVYGHLIALSLASVYLVYKTRLPLRFSYNHQAFKELIGTSIWSFLQMQIYFISNRIDRIIVGRFINTTALGTYEKAKSLSQMPSESLGDKLNSVFFSSFSRAQDNKESVNNLFRKGLLLVTAITFPIYFGMYVTSSHFVIVLLGEKWEGMIEVFKIMATAGIFASINGFLSALAVGAGYFKSYTIRYGVSAVALFIGSLLYVDNGIESVAIIYTIYSILLMILSFNIVQKKYDISWSLLISACVPAVVASVAMSFTVVILREFLLNEYTVFNFLLLICTGVLTYSIVMLVLPTAILKDIRHSLFRDLAKLYTKIVKR